MPEHTGYRSAFDRDTTFWTFLEQVLVDGSCRDATRLVQAVRERQQQAPISSAHVAYCRARARLPLDLIEGRADHMARDLQASARRDWHGRSECCWLMRGAVNCPTRPKISRPIRSRVGKARLRPASHAIDRRVRPGQRGTSGLGKEPVERQRGRPVRGRHDAACRPRRRARSRPGLRRLPLLRTAQAA